MPFGRNFNAAELRCSRTIVGQTIHSTFPYLKKRVQFRFQEGRGVNVQ